VVAPASRRISRVRRYSRSGPTAVHLRSPTGLSPPAVTRSSGLRLKGVRAARRLPPPPAHSSNPPQASPAGYSARGVWAPPRSLAATKGILSVPRGTEMFQFPRCPPKLAPGCPAVRRAGCPIRRSPDHWLPAPPRGISPRGRVLRRPPTPRHPPCAHHADSCASFPSSRRRCRDSRPARARGTCPSWLGTAPMSRTPIVPDSLVMFRDVCIYAVRAGDPPRAPVRHRSRCGPGLGSREAPSQDLACSRGRRTPRVPRGALSMCNKGRTPREVVKPRPKSCHDLGRGLPTVRSPDRSWRKPLALSQDAFPGSARPGVEPRGFEPRTSAVQGRRSPG
jgi:hypothetical protein